MRRQASPPYRASDSAPAVIWHRAGGRPLQLDLTPGRAITIGRDPANVLAIDAPLVSKAHAAIRLEGGDYIIEDLGSSNGTLLNGHPIAVSVLAPGDRIEIGGERIEFIDRERRPLARPAAAPSPQRTKLLRLGLAGAVAMVVMIVVMRLFVFPSRPVSASASPSMAGDLFPVAASAAAQAPTPTGGVALPQVGTSGQAGTEAPIVTSALERAQQAGVRAADALVDEAGVQQKARHYLEAVQLLTAVLARDPRHVDAAALLAEATAARDLALRTYVAEAERAFGQLRYGEAERAWDAASALTQPEDPRHAAAQAGAARARALMKR